MMSILLSILIPAPAQGGIDTTTPPPPSPLKFADSCREWAPPPPQGLIYQAKRHRTHPNTYFALKQRKLQLENSSFRDYLMSHVMTSSHHVISAHKITIRGCRHEIFSFNVSSYPLQRLHLLLTRSFSKDEGLVPNSDEAHKQHLAAHVKAHKC